MREHMSAYVSIREDTARASATVREPLKVCVPLHTLQQLAYAATVSIRCNMPSSAFLCIRCKQTSACVSIPVAAVVRQQTSAYVSRRRCNSNTLQQLGYAASMRKACAKLFFKAALLALRLLYACFTCFACIPAVERRSAACARHDTQRSHAYAYACVCVRVRACACVRACVRACDVALWFLACARSPVLLRF
jgi:hypothetical protein